MSRTELSEAVKARTGSPVSPGHYPSDQVVSDDAETDSEPMASVQVPAKLQTWGCGSAGTDHFTHLFPELTQGEWFGKKVHTGVKNAGRERPHCVSSLASQS